VINQGHYTMQIISHLRKEWLEKLQKDDEDVRQRAASLRR